jgi:hypothetical protein
MSRTFDVRPEGMAEVTKEYLSGDHQPEMRNQRSTRMVLQPTPPIKAPIRQKPLPKEIGR